MRSLVSDLIPEYNKKLHFFKETLAYVMNTPPSPPADSHHQPMCISLTCSLAIGKLSILHHMAV